VLDSDRGKLRNTSSALRGSHLCPRVRLLACIEPIALVNFHALI
jgi:hypothetical protein